MAELKLDTVQKTYPNGFKAIHGISIDIADSEFIVLVGPSGCGKSTLLRMIAGLETVSSGTMRIGERVVNELEPADRDIAMVFQNYALYPHMSVRGNMAYGLKNRGFDKNEIAKRVALAADILQLSALLDRRPRQLSGGQRQRVAMGRAIVREPAVFLFDEPLSNLDAKLRVQMRVEIKKLQKSLGTTSVYVTHDQVEAMTMADRLVVMNAGVAEQIGTPIEVYEKPASTFVASFIGSPAMNLMVGQITNDGTGVAVNDGTVLPLPNGGRAADSNRRVTMGLRPEHLTLSNGDGPGLKLAIDLVEHLGADTLIHGESSLVDSGLLTVRLSGHHHCATAETVTLASRPDQIHLFDSETHQRI